MPVGEFDNSVILQPFLPEATEEPVDWIPERRPDVVNDGDGDVSDLTEDVPTCFDCGRPGRLVLCDRTKCGRAYHLTCIGVWRLPHGWHFSTAVVSCY